MPRVTRQNRLSQGQPAIQIFTRATKAGVSPQLPGKNTTSLPVSPSKKRKLQELENVDTGTRQPVDEAETPSKTLKISQLSVASPRSGHYASPKRTPSRRVRGSAIAESPSAPNTPSKQRTLDFAKASVEPKLAPRAACVIDFLDLHLAFVQAFSLHAAHNGPRTPADLREFLPSVTRIWKKRKVQVKDLQRLFWVWDRSLKAKDISYRLANYGLGKVCVERTFNIEEQPPALQDFFEQSLDLLWEQTEESLKDAKEEDRPAFFLETIGLACIHESLTPLTSFHKGQQRLQDLKGGVIRAKMEKLRAESQESTPEARAPTNARRMGLLERIKNKQLHQSKLPPPPSKKDVLRLSAAERVEDIAQIMGMLRPAELNGTGIKAMFAAQRKPFTMDTMIDHVRDSIRTPIPRDEIETCIEILADTRVAGHWVSIVTVNEMRSVVLRSCKDIAASELPAKVAVLKAEWEKPASCVKAPLVSV
ncbi:hypothetical protein N7468_004758 [Penicillium chermesinum]|uniref:DNA replication factor Cdt1 C-terminal domain-containing protein n=1 Tax=Penicillium chermesinum TaxID=63820 RepID=A0A9W9P8Y0_9EURO|nr:uncharacterized protein N7468_004758 [Penicillium chermesinum]KAJ5240139.1 hypothetical protein N7468_004758 [Penicillium chermesinum]KAJ6167014.1 hypothetical protein N7470_002461 [Penicillium chermesinum]